MGGRARRALGLGVARHPIRREIVPGRSVDDAFQRFEAMAKDRLLVYARRALHTRDAAELDERFREVALAEAFLGTAEDCVAQIAALAAALPVDPLIIRAQWPDMPAQAVVDYLDDLGREIVPAVREIRSVPRLVR